MTLSFCLCSTYFLCERNPKNVRLESPKSEESSETHVSTYSSLLFIRITNVLPRLNIHKFFLILILELFLKFSDFEPRIILELFLNAKGLPSPKTLRNIFQYFFMFYYIIKLCKSLYLLSIMQKSF